MKARLHQCYSQNIPHSQCRAWHIELAQYTFVEGRQGRKERGRGEEGKEVGRKEGKKGTKGRREKRRKEGKREGRREKGEGGREKEGNK